MKVIIYTLTPEGEVPTYITDGGYFANPNGLPSPQDFNLLGVATDGDYETELRTKADIVNYVSSFIDSFSHPTTEEVKSVENVVGQWCNEREIL